MTYILNIETATKVCSVSISKDGQDYLLKEFEGEQFSHSEMLNAFIEELIKESTIDFKDLNAVAISAGPGSYTGLRIGSSSAKGLCYALDIPLIAVHSMESMFAFIRRSYPDYDLYVPMIDARRMEVYSAIYSSQGKELKSVSADILEVGIYDEYFQTKRVLIFGNGAEKSREVFQGDQFDFDEATNMSALGMNQISFEKYQQKRFEDLAYFEPNYLKDFIAGKPKKLL
ncbi:MAG: tRNA (adenosine(37)-N6)-threonylcarbamoyltransferase complex dimerization subunit type 1 TsaB [Crocinitomicaceae bacterium]|nr:tRNA (adenosine(37)-N6)-threonylcarbamoyltransferase complex dimerization subunit type 1 TsaB [Crocinitomicaceae bacterium]